jgi:hypothetical protein
MNRIFRTALLAIAVSVFVLPAAYGFDGTQPPVPPTKPLALDGTQPPVPPTKPLALDGTQPPVPPTKPLGALIGVS